VINMVAQESRAFDELSNELTFQVKRHSPGHPPSLPIV
jgi:hypothetical protein